MSQIDPVCGKVLRPAEVVASTCHEVQMYHFCSQECHGRFLANPARYVEPGTDIPRPVTKDEPRRLEAPLPWHRTG